MPVQQSVGSKCLLFDNQGVIFIIHILIHEQAMSVSRKLKNQYVEHYEEYVGEEAKPFVAFLEEENQVKDPKKQPAAEAIVKQTTSKIAAPKKKPFWRKITTLFSY